MKSLGIAVEATKGDNAKMDANTLAKSIVDQATGDKPKKKVQPATANRGLKRAAALTSERRIEIAKKAAQTRWPQNKDHSEE